MVVHRSDGSGTTYVWADYLSKVSDEWRRRVGRSTSVNWPVGTGASGNQGVAEMIKAAPNAIGYIELTYAIREQLSYGDVQNVTGHFVNAKVKRFSLPQRSGPANHQRGSSCAKANRRSRSYSRRGNGTRT